MDSNKRLKDVVKKCIVYGDFILHSGQTTNWKCDLLLQLDHFCSLMVGLWPRHPIIGIELGGALLAQSWSNRSGIIRKDGSLYWPQPKDRTVSLIDDVTTTGNSFKEAEKILAKNGIKVVERLVILDRRIDKDIEIRALFTSKDLDLEPK